MTDRQKDDEYNRARRLAYSVDKGRLERIRSGSYVIKDIPEYIRLMRKHGFNPESMEHCALIAETLEQRLEQEKSKEIILEEGGFSDTQFMISYSTTGMIEISRSAYSKICGETESKLEEIFGNFGNLGLFGHVWEEDIFNKIDSRYHLRIKSSSNNLEIVQVFKNGNAGCSHGFMDLKIFYGGLFSNNPRIDGYACSHIMEHGAGIIVPKSLPFGGTAKRIFNFYTKHYERGDGPETLEIYLRFFVNLPNRLKEVCEKKVNTLL